MNCENNMKLKWMKKFFNQLSSYNHLLIFFGWICSVWMGCEEKSPTQIDSDIIKVAEVNGKVLNLDELHEMFPDRVNQADSSLIANALADRWIRKEVFLSEARRSMTDMDQLNALVEDYRESLIIHGYENQLMRSEEHTSELQSRGHLVCR